MAGPQRHAVKVFEEHTSMKTTHSYTDLTTNVTKPVVGRPVLRNVANMPHRRPAPKKETSKGKLHLKNEEENVDKHVKQKENIPVEVEVENIEKNIKTVVDIDEDDTENTTLCAEYVKDIYKYLRECEKRLLPSDYLPKHHDLTEKMRTILIDWLIQVHSKFNLLQETLYLTVYFIDRFFDKQHVKRNEVQLVGVTAMLLASKYEELYAPEVGDFVYITDNAYSKEKIKTMEHKMLKVLEYDLSNPTCLHFLRRNSKAGEVSAIKHTLAKFFMELTLTTYKLICRYPSEIAAAALYLSIQLIDSSEWTPTLEHYSGYTEQELLPVVGDIATLVLAMDGCKYEAVKTKYSATKLMKVSRLPELRGRAIKLLATRGVLLNR